METNGYIASDIKKIRQDYKNQLITANEMYNQALIIYKNCEDRDSATFQMLWVYYDFLKKSENNENKWFKTLTKIDEIIIDTEMDKDILYSQVKLSFRKLIETNPRIELSILEKHYFTNLKEVMNHLREQYHVTKMYETLSNSKYKISDIQERLKVLIEFKSEQLTNIVSKIISDKKENRNSIIDLFDILGNSWFVGEYSEILNACPISYQGKEEDRVRFTAPTTLLEKFAKAYIGSILPFCDAFNDPIFSEYRARSVIVAIDEILLNHKNYHALKHEYCKLLLELKEYEKGRKIYCSYIKKHANNYWAWELLGDLCENLEEQGYCYIRALNCKPEENQKRSILIKALPYLKKYNLLDNAIAEINNYIDFCNNKKLNIDNRILNWKNQLIMTDNIKVDYELYKISFDPTEKLLYGDTEYVDIFITYINHEKRAFNFNMTDRDFGYLFVPDKFDLEKIELYSSLNVQIYSKDDSYGERKYVLLDIKYEVKNNSFVGKFFQSIRSEIMKSKNKQFAFTYDGAYVSKDVLASKDLLSLESYAYGWDEYSDREEKNYGISGFKVFKYNSKEKKSGWNVIRIDEVYEC